MATRSNTRYEDVFDNNNNKKSALKINKHNNARKVCCLGIFFFFVVFSHHYCHILPKIHRITVEAHIITFLCFYLRGTRVNYYNEFLLKLNKSRRTCQKQFHRQKIWLFDEIMRRERRSIL